MGIDRVYYLKEELEILNKRIIEIKEELKYHEKYKLYRNLSHREMQIISLIKFDMSNKEMADSLNLSPHTIKKYISSILQKLDIKSRQQIIKVVK